MLVVPLIMASMTVGISQLGDIRKLGGIGGRTITYYMITTALSVIVGIFLVNIIQPGHAETEEERIAMRGGIFNPQSNYSISSNTITLTDVDFFRDYDDRYMISLEDQNGVRGIVKESKAELNALTVQQWVDKTEQPITPDPTGTGFRVDLAITERVKGKSGTIGTVLKDVVVGLIPHNLFAAMMNNDVLPLIVFSLIFGAVLTTLGATGKPVIQFFEGLNEAIMKIIHLLMLVAPVGIGALIAGRLGDAGGFAGFLPELVRLGKYAGTVIVGLAIHGFVTLPLILRFFAQRKVSTYALNSSTALTTAFSTSSSAATLPLTMECTTEKTKCRSGRPVLSCPWERQSTWTVRRCMKQWLLYSFPKYTGLTWAAYKWWLFFSRRHWQPSAPPVFPRPDWSPWLSCCRL